MERPPADKGKGKEMAWEKARERFGLCGLVIIGSAIGHVTDQGTRKSEGNRDL